MTDDTLMIPYGKTDFAVMRRKGYYYVDKTRFIKKLEREGNFVFFLRPRRFGKSLFVNMLQVYYDVNYADEFDVLFGDLEIGKSPTEEHNKYLITTTEPELNHGYSDLYMEPWNDECQHLFLVELKYCKHNSPDSEVEKMHKEALDQLERYSTAKQLQQKAEGNGWTLHKLAIVFRGWEVQVCEEQLLLTSSIVEE